METSSLGNTKKLFKSGRIDIVKYEGGTIKISVELMKSHYVGLIVNVVYLFFFLVITNVSKMSIGARISEQTLSKIEDLQYS